MGTKNQREKIRAQEAVERSNYMKEKQKHLIVIDLKYCVLRHIEKNSK